MEAISHSVNDLSHPDRAALEHLLGRELRQDQQIVVIAFGGNESAEQAREAARARIRAIVEKAAQNATVSGVTAEEADAAIDEAMEVIRHRVPR